MSRRKLSLDRSRRRHPARQAVGAAPAAIVAAAVLPATTGSSAPVADAVPVDARDQWDLGRPVETWGPQLRLDLERTTTVAGIDLTWRGDLPDSLRVEYSTDVHDTDRTVAIDNVAVTDGATLSIDFPDPYTRGS